MEFCQTWNFSLKGRPLAKDVCSETSSWRKNMNPYHQKRSPSITNAHSLIDSVENAFAYLQQLYPMNFVFAR